MTPSPNLSYFIYHFGPDIHFLTGAIFLFICSKIYRASRK